jgi:hypothetical protein
VQHRAERWAERAKEREAWSQLARCVGMCVEIFRDADGWVSPKDRMRTELRLVETFARDRAQRVGEPEAGIWRNLAHQISGAELFFDKDERWDEEQDPA